MVSALRLISIFNFYMQKFLYLRLHIFKQRECLQAFIFVCETKYYCKTIYAVYHYCLTKIDNKVTDLQCKNLNI